MLNPTDINEIIEDTLKELGARDLSISMLIQLTFLLESGLEDLRNSEGNNVGLGQMNKKDMCYIIENYIIPRKQLGIDVNRISLLNVHKDSYDVLFKHLMTNIRFQICMTYLFYKSKWDCPPKDDVYDIIKYYFLFCEGRKNLPSKEYVERVKHFYEEVFFYKQ